MTTKPPPKAAPVEKKRNRLTPIPSTIDTIRGYPSKLIIYKTDASRFFWVRVYFNNRYHTKSTKTETVGTAKAFAVTFYESVLVSARINHVSDRSKSFAVIGTSFFTSAEKTTKASVYRSDWSRYKTDLLPVFGEQEIDTITNAQISGLHERLHKRNLSPATIKHFMVVLRKVFKFAVANNQMRHIPEFPRVVGRLATAQKRDYLTIEEYKNVVETAERLSRQEVKVRGVLLTLEVKHLIQFMVNTFIRPSDLRVIKHQHITKKEENGEAWLVLNHPATKTNANEVQAMPATVHVYENIVKAAQQQQRSCALDDFVFFPQYANRDTAMAVIGRLFNRVIEETGIETATGKNITLYSLRHTAIMLRLTIGAVSTIALARNARTSEQMIDKYYASHLTTTLVRKELHAFPNESKTRKAKPKPKPDASQRAEQKDSVSAASEKGTMKSGNSAVGQKKKRSTPKSLPSSV
jgi:integrase